MQFPKVSIIIPCRTFVEAGECVSKCLELEYPDYEIIVLPDKHNLQFAYAYVRICETGKLLPSHKRDIGINLSRGEIIAFIDADAYPPHDWLNLVVAKMKKEKFSSAGVCGPGIVPEDATWRERGADWILQKLPYNYRVIQRPARKVDDFPTFNLVIWKKYIDEVGGFSCDYLTGEDTYLCLKIVRRSGMMFRYDPTLFVYHHRRELYLPFFKQIAKYGKRRGYFFKRYPETSRRLVYAIPSLFWGGVCLLLLVLWVWLAQR